MTTSPVITLSPGARDFLDELLFASVATVDEDGSPHLAVAWYLIEDDTIVLNSADGRHWPANLRRDARVAVSVEDGYRYVALRGTVEIDDDQTRAQADIAAMARRYHADEPERAERMIRDRFCMQRRVSFRLRPTQVYEHFE